MCSVELPFALILDNAMRRSHVRSQPRRSSPPPEPRPAAVRRALFAEPVDHQETARVLAREFSELQKDAKSRWNYDFETDTPLPGRFEWQAVAAADQPAVSPARTEALREEPAPRQKQRKLTDYLSQRKRTSSTALKSPPPVKSSKSVASSSPAT